jgi:hypothetical protein
MQPLNFFLAFIVVLGLIGLATWLVRRFAANRIGASSNRGRMPRLAVIDAAAVDSRRRLVLIRRDNVEHLLMIGGPSDIVVEPNIVRASPAREQVPPRLPTTDFIAESEPPPRPEPMEYIEPAPEPAPRPARPAFADELRRPPAPPVAERRDPLAGFSPERPEPALREPPLREPVMREPVMREPAHREPPLREPRAMPRTEPMIPRPPRPELPKAPPVTRTTERPATSAGSAAAAAAADKNLAEMAQRLEAALRRPGADPRAEARPAAASVAPPTAPEPPASRPAPRPAASHVEDEIASVPAEETADTPKASFKNLEDEMASLLGRPKTPT